MTLQYSLDTSRSTRMWIILLVFTLVTAAAQDRRQGPLDPCPGPTASVIVMALEDPVSGDAHMLILKNDARSSILMLVVGFGQKSELHSIDFAVPRQIVGPPGWDAQSAFGEDSIFMRWIWEAATKQTAIAPGELVSGFKVVLPPFPAELRGHKYSDGAPLIPIKPSDLPFRVVFQNGECAWGRVRPLVLGSPTK
jgi:hypothetical protein